MGIKYVLRGMLTLLLAAQMAFVGAAETITYYHNDALGSPVAATDEAGNLLWREAYRPYGSRLLKEDGGTNDTWFTGKQEDSGTGLSYFGARWYDPNIGRFMAIDPVGFKEGNIHSFNRYAYANNNPYGFVDPNGEYALPVYIAAGVVVLAIIASAQQTSNNINGLPSGNIGFPSLDNLLIPLGPGGGYWNEGSDEGDSDKGDHEGSTGLIEAPDELPAFPDAEPAKPKTSVQGGGGKRKRWKDKKGRIYEWDSQHGTVEKYNKSGKKHLGEFDPNTGDQIKPPAKGRTVEK